VGSILEVKFQLVMCRFKSIVVLSLLFVIFSLQAFSQCPEKVVLDIRNTASSDLKELNVLDSFESNVNISGFEINIFDNSTGKYLYLESSNFPSIGISNDIDVSKSGNRILLRNIPENINLLNCVIIFIGEECPAKKVSISEQ
jgi:hypothetical protein